MSKKWIIVISVFVGFVGLCLILFWTLFGLSSIEVQYSSTTQNLTLSEEEIVQAGEFNLGSCVLFQSKKTNFKKLEKAVQTNENFAYLKVLNIETKFPNKFIIHVREREELFALENAGKFLICDREFRVLRVSDYYSSNQTNAVLLSGIEFENATVVVGDFLKIKQDSMKNLYSVFAANNRSFGEVLSKFKSMTVEDYQDEFTHKHFYKLTMKTFADREFVIKNIDFALENKIRLMFAVESSMYNIPENTKVIKLSSGEYVSYEAVKDQTDEDGNLIYNESDAILWTSEVVNSCYVLIDNLTLSDKVKRTEKDIYYAFVEK